MREDVKYWLWMQLALGVGIYTEKIFSKYSNAKEVFFESCDGRRESGVFSAAQLKKLEGTSITQAEDIIARCEKKNWNIYTPTDADYPKKLLSIADVPLVLYCYGEMPDNEKLGIAIVGARDATEYGISVAEHLASSLSKAGALIVSGGAAGIDSAGHRGAIFAGGKTYAVLGNGFGSGYVGGGRVLWTRIAENGGLITEYSPGTPAFAYNFPKRNRIISGMTSGTVVVQAASRSGSLITARLAGEQGRDVFAVPGDVTSPMLTGGNMLIKHGAKPVFSAADILSEFKNEYSYLSIDEEDSMLEEASSTKSTQSAKRQKHDSAKPAKNADKRVSRPIEKKNAPDELTDDERAVYAVLSGEPQGVDDIGEKCGFDSRRVLAALTGLEIAGLAQCTVGNGYRAVFE